MATYNGIKTKHSTGRSVFGGVVPEFIFSFCYALFIYTLYLSITFDPSCQRSDAMWNVRLTGNWKSAKMRKQNRKAPNNHNYEKWQMTIPCRIFVHFCVCMCVVIVACLCLPAMMIISSNFRIWSFLCVLKQLPFSDSNRMFCWKYLRRAMPSKSHKNNANLLKTGKGKKNGGKNAFHCVALALCSLYRIFR